MTSINVADLIGQPYKDNGRGNGGYDCYGLAIEVEKRLGKELIDVYYDNHNKQLAEEYAPLLNLRKTDFINTGVIIEMHKDGLLHIGVAINKVDMIHATRNQGVRISRIGIIPVINTYEVINLYGRNKHL